MAGGAVGGLALWSVIFPADLVKSRIQVSSLDTSFIATTLDIIRKEGKYYEIILFYCQIYNIEIACDLPHRNFDIRNYVY